jgi:putative endonuclease
LCSQKHLLGKDGEQVALAHLIKLGYTIETRNYRCPFGEVDIIARDHGILAFVEVKTRRSQRFGTPKEAVDFRKQQRINRIALYYLAGLGQGESEELCRFDVVSISLEPKAGWMVELIKDAFPLL